jgi:hypothetical protein
MLLKIAAFGLLCEGEGTYLRSPWNVFDAVVVLSCWPPILLPDIHGGGGALRAFRALRPLRALSRFPGIKRLVTAIMLAVPRLGSLMILTLIYFIQFSVIGLQLFKGAWLQRCHELEPSSACEGTGDCGSQVKDIDDFSEFCDTAVAHNNLIDKSIIHDMSGVCGPNSVCTTDLASPVYFGIISFNDFGHSMLLVPHRTSC